jgi:hypothetical protein
MLKVLDDLEKAVGRMMEKARTRDTNESGSEGDQSMDGAGNIDSKDRSSEPLNEEAAEFIRRAIKRLKSL